MFRTYSTTDPSQADYPVKVWQAGRATSAAPLLFDPFTIEEYGITVTDGALRLNNPIFEAMAEARRIDRNRKFGCVVSIGTGVADVKGLDTESIKMHEVAKTCVDIAINCDNVARDFVGSDEGGELDNSHRYFRFDVRRQLDAVDLVDWTRLNDITAYVDHYLSEKDTGEKLQRCADALS